MRDYKVNFEINTCKSFDSKKGKECLDVMTNMSKDITRFYYETIEDEYIKNMPNQLLLKLFKQCDEELTRREEILNEQRTKLG
jgi:CO dehydrogenase/acetyl-CoA synthase alpha subunit